MSHARRPLGALIMVACAAGSWGLWSLFLRHTALPGAWSSLFMVLFVGLFSLPIALSQPRPRWTRRALGLLALLAACDALNMATFFAAFDHTTVAVAVLTHYFAPVLVALASPLIERTSTPGAPLAALVAVAGLALVLEPWRADPADGLWLGAALGAISAVGYAGYVFVARRLVPAIGSGRALSYHGLLAALLLLPPALASDAPVHLHDVAIIAAGSLLLGTVGGVLFIIGLDRVGSAKASILTFAEPLVAVVVAWIAFDEALSPWAALGAALVVAAGVYVARAPSRPHAAIAPSAPLAPTR